MIYENHRRERVVMLPIALESGTFSLMRHTLQLHLFLTIHILHCVI